MVHKLSSDEDSQEFKTLCNSLLMANIRETYNAAKDAIYQFMHANLKEPFCQHELVGKTIVEHVLTKHRSSKRDLLVNSPLPNQNFRNKKIGHDLDKAIADDMTDIFKNAA